MLQIVEGIRTAAAGNALAPALMTGSRVINYSELLGLVARISNHLVDRGVKRGARLFLNVSDSDLRLVAMIAAMHAGMVPFTLLQLGEAKSEIGYDLIVGVGAPSIPDLARDVVIEQAVLTGPKGDATLRDFPDHGDDDILYVASTTGTTGRRKLLAMTFGRFNRPRPGSLSRDFVPGDRLMVTLGSMTAVGVSYAFRLLKAGGTHVRTMPGVTDRLRLINLAAVNRLVTTPETVAEMMDVMEAIGARCPSVARIFLTGNLVPAGLAERLERNFQAETRIQYGASEAGSIAGGRLTAADFQPGYVGQPASGITIVSAGTPENPAPVTVVNERAGIASSYVRGKAVPIADRTYTLPDLGYMKDGSLFIVGRDDEVFNLDGNKVAYSLIERDLRKLDGVKEVAVVGGAVIGDPARLFIAVVAAPQTDLLRLRAELGKTLKVPAGDKVHIFRVAQVPRNAMGKVDRMEVAKAYTLTAKQA